jgi:GNAT superfamily N-acetyltransferase
MTDDDLYMRGAATLLASWEEYARGSAGAALMRLNGVSAAVFPSDPERAIYNNALLDRDLGPSERTAAVDAMAAAYVSAGVDRYAAWVHESDEGMRAELSSRAYTLDESTRAMGMSLDDISRGRPDVEVGAADWAAHLQYLRVIGVPAGLLSGVDPNAFHVLVARRAGENIATALAFDHSGDCGVFNVGTLEAERRRGLGTALTARLLHDAIERGCTTASLQSTAMAERVYAAIGFRDLGRILEYAPPAPAANALPSRHYRLRRERDSLTHRTGHPPSTRPTPGAILAISGSLRRSSINSAALRAALRHRQERSEIEAAVVLTALRPKEANVTIVPMRPDAAAKRPGWVAWAATTVRAWGALARPDAYGGSNGLVTNALSAASFPFPSVASTGACVRSEARARL